MAQDEVALKSQFAWNAPADVKEQFGKIEQARVMKSANVLAGMHDTMSSKPLRTKNLGMPNPMLNMYHKCGEEGGERTNFGKACTWFGGTDAYYEARSDKGHCDCVNDKCD